LVIGSISAATAFSFYAIKNLTTGEGGMITTDDAEYAEKMRIFSLHGITHDAWKRYSAEGSWYYEVAFPGFKCNLSDIQSSLGLHQLARLEEMIRRRTELVARYDEGLSSLPEIKRPSVRPGVRHAWHLYAIRLRLEMLKIDRAQFIERLKAEGIGTSVHFIPLHRQPYYRDRFGLTPADYPVADAAYQRLIPALSLGWPSAMSTMVEAVRRVVQRHRW
jgi:dTDP-4-amino-4,6-dideoxygalactose transaminase